MHDRVLEHLLALLEGEERLTLLRIPKHRHDDLVEEAAGALDDLEMTVVERVERSG